MKKARKNKMIDKTMEAITQALRDARTKPCKSEDHIEKAFDRWEGESLEEYDNRMERYNLMLRGRYHLYNNF